MAVAAATSLASSAARMVLGSPSAPDVYMVDFACYKPPDELRVHSYEVEEHGKHWPMYSESVRDFCWKIFLKSGLGDKATYLPANIHPVHTRDPRSDAAVALAEARMVMTGAVSELLERTGIHPREVDILITCTSVFSATPSLASMLVNHFKMRKDVQAYHLGGMGCSAGTVAICLCRDMLKAHPNANLLFVCNEVLSTAFYPGTDKAFMVSNVIFRMGGAAVMMSNKPSMAKVAKYKLEHAIRTHHGQDDTAYQCMAWKPDAQGIHGIYLSKDVVKSAAVCMEDVLRQITPRILTWGQYGEAAYAYTRAALGYAAGSASGRKGKPPPPPEQQQPSASGSGNGKAGSGAAPGGGVSASGEGESEPVKRKKSYGLGSLAAGLSRGMTYRPDYTRCVDHFLIHAGGYAVLKGLQDALALPTHTMITSFAALREYGNTSSSTTWYALGYAEACEGVKKGQRVLQLGVGGGMKGGANVWRALRDVDGSTHRAWAHYNGRPLTDADLPRGVDDDVVRHPKYAELMVEAQRAVGGSVAAAEARLEAEERKFATL